MPRASHAAGTSPAPSVAALAATAPDFRATLLLMIRLLPRSWRPILPAGRAAEPFQRPISFALFATAWVKKGRPLFFMPAANLYYLDDDDLGAVIA